MICFLVSANNLVDDANRIEENYAAVTLLLDQLDQLPDNDIRNAIVLPLDDLAKKNLVFFDIAARGRGVNVRTFNTREEALAWLQSA